MLKSGALGYLDFDIVIADGRVSCQSPDGESAGELKLAPRQDEVRRALVSVAQASQEYVRRGVEDSRLDPIRDIGTRLFATLFEGVRLAQFKRSLDTATYRNMALRLRLRIEQPDLDGLPWEFLHDGTDFLGLTPRVSIVRVRAGPRARRPLRAALPLRLLLVTADISGKMGEARVIELLEKVKEAMPMKLEILRAATLSRLAQALASEPFHIVHLYGVAEEVEAQQALALFDDSDRGRAGAARGPAYFLASAAELRPLFDRCPDLRLAYLDVNNSDRLAGELARGLPAAIGTRGTPSLPAVGVFAEEFYRALSAGQPLDAVVTQARQAIDLRRPGSREWGLQVFYLQAEDSVFLADVGGPAIGGTGAPVEAPPVRSTGKAVHPEQNRERKMLQSKLSIQQRNLEELERQAAYASIVPPALREQIVRTRQEIEELTRRLKELE